MVEGAFEARLALDDEAMFAGHYPGAPIFPGTFLVEAVFQAASTALGGGVCLNELVACRFHSPLLPGDELFAHFTLKEVGAGAALVEVTVSGRAQAAELTMLVAAGANSGAAVSPPQAGTSVRALDASFIHRALPHRQPALLVDSALAFDAPDMRTTLFARRSITGNEPCYAGAGGLSIGSFPASLIAESFCQSCGLLRAATGIADEPRDETRVPVVAKLAGLRFFGDAVPGDLLEHHVRLVVGTGDGAVFSGRTLVAGRLVMHAARVVASLAPIPSLRTAGP
jgi:3-hydroxyacyl-[acyl-carrier-protein] dehydratase